MGIHKYIITIFLVIIFGVSQSIWIETSQSDFADGCYETNIYASMKYGGTIEFTQRWDLNNDGFIDILISNEYGNAYIYWGSDSGFCPSDVTIYSLNNGGDAETCDIDFDGYPELIITSCTGNLIRIFKGTENGPDAYNYDNISLNDWNESCCVADCNKDGYLDIVAARYSSGLGVIFWGGPNGYSPLDTTLLPVKAEHNLETADFNKDGWMDILFEQQTETYSLVFWGSASGYNPGQVTQIQNAGNHAHGSSVADLDDDGYLDIVLTCFGSNALVIYRGSDTGFIQWQVLYPGRCYGGSSVADMNDDGYLDIICTPGYGVTEYPVVYWGSTSGYSETNKSQIGVPSDASGLLVADFNQDQHFDVLIHNYGYPPEPSYILMGPNYVPIYSLPTVRDHHGRFREIGNVYNRQYYEEYVSSVFDAQHKANWHMVEWDDSLPWGSSVGFCIRTGYTPVVDSYWSRWLALDKGDTIPDTLSSQYLQYKVIFLYASPCYLPSLEEVRISFDPEQGILEKEYVDEQIDIVVQPNPFSSKVTIMYTQCHYARTTVVIYNAIGQRIETLVDCYQSPGKYQFQWDGGFEKDKIYSSGVYFIHIRIGENQIIRPIMYISLNN